jgi:hypothetical protein
MRNARLILSGLDASAAADLPALRALLARGRDLPGDYDATPAQRLASLFAPRPGSLASLAAARMARDGLATADSGWVCADPVHLRLMRDHILLGDAHVFELDAHESHALLDALNAHFAGQAEFRAAAPARWYARFAGIDPAEAVTPLDACLARPVDARMTDTALARLLTEAQMVLHAHPVNEAREARGVDPVNSLWLWGHGADDAPRAPATRMLGDGILGASLARAAGLPWDELDMAGARLAEPVADTLICVESLHAPARYGQAEALRARLETLEVTLFAPLRDALRRGRLDTLDIEILGDTGLGRRVRRWDMWKFWR